MHACVTVDAHRGTSFNRISWSIHCVLGAQKRHHKRAIKVQLVQIAKISLCWQKELSRTAGKHALQLQLAGC